MVPVQDIVQIKGLSIGYHPGKCLVEGFDEFARESELIAVLGENGAGKSTLFRVLAGLQKPLSGQVEIEGARVESYSRGNLARKLAYMTTRFLPAGNISVEQLVSLGRSPFTGWLGRLSPCDRDKVEKALVQTGLNELRKRHVVQLSDGEKQKVMIARCMAQDTRLMIMDEPTAFLDLPNKYRVASLLHGLTKNERKTIIFSSHDLNIVLQFADKVWLVANNKVFSGAPEDLMINNKLNDLLEKVENLNFDLEKGDFDYRKEGNQKIYLEADGKLRLIAEKALKRLDFQVSGDKQLEDRIKLIQKDNNQPEWHVLLNNRIFIAGSIYELCHFLKS